MKIPYYFKKKLPIEMKQITEISILNCKIIKISDVEKSEIFDLNKFEFLKVKNHLSKTCIKYHYCNEIRYLIVNRNCSKVLQYYFKNTTNF